MVQSVNDSAELNGLGANASNPLINMIQLKPASDLGEINEPLRPKH